MGAAKEKDIIIIHQDKDVDLKLKDRFQKIKNKKISLDDFFSEFLGQFLSEQTKKAYQNDLASFFSFLAKGGEKVKHPKEISGGHFQVYRDELLAQNYSSATINRKLVAIRSFMKWSLAKRLIDHNPLDVIKLPKIETTSPTLAFEDYEVVEMLGKPDTTTKVGIMHKTVIHLLFSLGLRRSELANIKIKDFYKDRGHYILHIKGKGGKHRHLPITKDLALQIEEYMTAMANFGLQLSNEDFLIQSSKKEKNKKPINGSTIYRIIEKYSKLCGINKKVGPHSCRATAISHLLDTKKTPIRDVAIFAGHSNITTTERYDKRRESLDNSAAYDIDYESDGILSNLD